MPNFSSNLKTCSFYVKFICPMGQGSFLKKTAKNAIHAVGVTPSKNNQPSFVRPDGATSTFACAF
jgi:hypothetical protein